MSRRLALVPTLALLAAGMSAAEEAAPAPSSETIEVRGSAAATLAAPSDIAGTALFGTDDRRVVPFAVSVLDRDLITATGATRPSDILRYDPAVQPSGGAAGGYYESFQIRGFGLDNWHNYQQDGVTIINQATTPLENKERVEVLKGPAALRFGVAAPGGVINYVTKLPTAVPYYAVHLSADLHGGLLTHADVGGRFGADDRFGYRINVALENIDQPYGTVDGKRRLVAAALDWRIREHTTLTILADDNRTEMNGGSGRTVSLDVNGGIPAYDHDRFFGQEWTQQYNATRNLGFRLDHRLSERWTLTSVSNSHELRRTDWAIYAEDVQPDGTFDAYEYHSPGERREALTNMTFVRGEAEAAGMRHHLTLGWSWTRRDAWWGDGVYDLIGTGSYVEGFELVPSTSAPPAARHTNRAYERSVYALDRAEIGAGWEVVAGARFTHIDSIFWSSTDGSQESRYTKGVVTPTVGVLWVPAPWVTTYASYGSGVEEGGEAPVGTTNAGEVMDPLVAWQGEIGAKADLRGGRLTADAAVFYISKPSEYTDGSNTYVQDGEQVHLGIEASLRGQVHERVALTLGAQWLDAELTKTGDAALDGSTPANVPAFTATGFVDWRLPVLDGFSAQFGATWVGEREVTTPNTVTVDGYLLADAGLGWRGRLDGSTAALRLWVRNLADEEYVSSAKWGSLELGAPRSIGLTGSLEF
jgi:iron complex outermembrane receptor protein